MPTVSLPNRCGPHTVAGFRAAAEARLRDGLLLADGPADGWMTAIYLWGYSVEMVLKAAVELVAETTAGFGLADLRLLAEWGHECGVGWPKPPPLHAVGLWGATLVALRAAIPDRAYPVAGFADEVSGRSQEVQLGWRETLRYHDTAATLGELWTACEHVTWFVSRMRQL